MICPTASILIHLYNKYLFIRSKSLCVGCRGRLRATGTGELWATTYSWAAFRIRLKPHFDWYHIYPRISSCSALLPPLIYQPRLRAFPQQISYTPISISGTAFRESDLGNMIEDKQQKWYAMRMSNEQDRLTSFKEAKLQWLIADLDLIWPAPDAP